MNDLAKSIWARQYAMGNETIQEGFARVASAVAKSPSDQVEYLKLMNDFAFIPGGRILAGAGSEHGNILNCFVQDGSPEAPGGTRWALELAKKLALVTKVGGGNGLNLDPIPPKRPYAGAIGVTHVTIDANHADADKVKTGTFFDLTRGEYITRPYKNLRFIPSAHANQTITDGGYDTIIHVPDSIAGIWDSASSMVHALLAGKTTLIDLSALRPEGASVRGSGGASSGPSSFAVEVFELFARWAALGGAEYAGPVNTLRLVFASTLRSIRQGGTRRGAGMATITAQHPDLIDFITAKELAREAEEGDISTFNISVLATDEFMRAASRTESPEGHLLNLIATQAHATGEPGLLFITAINTNNPLTKTDGPIAATNPCVTGDTLILTSNGPKRFSDLANEHEDTPVVAINRVTRKMSVRTMRNPHCTDANARVLRVSFESGLSVTCTFNHSFIGVNGEKIRASALKTGDTVMGYDTDFTFSLAVMSVEDAGSAAVFNGMVDEDHTYVIVAGGTNGVVSANCGEIPLYPGEPCDLGALNLAAFVDDSGVFLEREFTDAVATAVRFLDDVLDRENAPLAEIRAAIDDKRRIGLGVMGLAHALIRSGVAYDSSEGRAWVAKVIGLIRDAGLAESERLGLGRGVPAGVQRAGLVRRNIALLTVAPTGTTSMLAGVSSGVEPVFAATLMRRIGTDYVQVIDPLLDEILSDHDPVKFVQSGGSSRFVVDGRWDSGALVDAIAAHHGSVAFALVDLPDDARLKAYRVAHDVSPSDHVLMQAAVQRAFDFMPDGSRSFAGNSISKTINLPNSSSVGDVLSAYRLAWGQGAKGITVYRDGSRQFQVLTAGGAAPTEETPAAEEQGMPNEFAVAATVRDVGVRPMRLRGFTDQVHLTDDLGNRRGFFITVNGDDSGVREVFITSGKAGDEANGDAEALGRVISIALQHGVPTEAIIRTLRGIAGGVFGSYSGHIIASKADLVAVALTDATQVFTANSPAVPTATQRSMPAPQPVPVGANERVTTCPHCGTLMRRTEGCMTCPNVDCGFSKC